MVETLLAPADYLRARFYRLFGPWVAPWVRQRELRCAVIGVLSVLVSLALAIGAPIWLLAVGPIVLGVPHVLSDVRYLGVQTGFYRQRKILIVVIPALIAGAVTAQVVFALGAALFALFAVRGSWQRRAIGVAVLLPLAYLSLRWADASALAFAHLHNLIAVLLWWALWRRKQRWHYMVLAVVAGGSLLITSGLLDHAIIAASGHVGPIGDRSMMWHAWTLAPFAEPMMALRLAVLFAFGQAVHYTIWLRLVPEDARTRTSPRPFASSWRALCQELGPIVLGLAALSALVVALWAVADLWAARDGYLRAAIFHGHLELAAAALLFVSAKRVERGA